MESKSVLGFLFIIFIFLSLSYYYLAPFNKLEFKVSNTNNNFTINNSFPSKIQFYDNLMFPSKKISYLISEECNLQKQNDMQRAFEILENKTILEFYSLEESPEIVVYCDEKNKRNGDFLIAGEGGPVNITKSGEYNVIFGGEILLIRDSKCPNPNVAIHELLHVLGFEHSNNPQNIMYNFSECEQTIGQDIIDLIDELYLIPRNPDLVLKNVSAIINGRYLDFNATMKNEGLCDSEHYELVVYGDDKEIKSFELEGLEIGIGRTIFLGNVPLKKTSYEKIVLELRSDFLELNKDNNKVELEANN